MGIIYDKTISMNSNLIGISYLFRILLGVNVPDIKFRKPKTNVKAAPEHE